MHIGQSSAFTGSSNTITMTLQSSVALSGTGVDPQLSSRAGAPQFIISGFTAEIMGSSDATVQLTGASGSLFCVGDTAERGGWTVGSLTLSLTMCSSAQMTAGTFYVVSLQVTNHASSGAAELFGACEDGRRLAVHDP
mmetsp:Transcript_18003/g.35170  ORF Transcript_18003/g.35170 Transcript_18003/m.35170 type:complete len:138 (-) Transcript_18003:697-1110(-)